jgi:hypothetical protein
MGNLLASTISIGVPLFNHLVTIPYLYHPYRWGGIPWTPPGFLKLAIATLIANVALIMLIGTISGIMSTKQKCNKTDLKKSIINSLWLTFGFLLSNGLLSVFASLKGSALVWLAFMPYASWIVQGLMSFVVVLFFGALGNNMLRNSVCRSKSSHKIDVKAKNEHLKKMGVKRHTRKTK